MVNKIFKLRNTILSSCCLNTTVAIVMSSLVELHRNKVLIRVYYLLLELCCAEPRALEFQSRVQRTQVEGFDEVIDQHLKMLSVPSTCRGTEQTEFRSSDPRRIGQGTEYRGRRSEVRQRKSEKKRGDRLGVWSIQEGVLREQRIM